MNNTTEGFSLPIQVARLLRKYDPAVRQLVNQELQERLRSEGRQDIRLEDVGYCVSAALEKLGRFASGFDSRLTKLSLDAHRAGKSITTAQYREQLRSRLSN